MEYGIIIFAGLVFFVLLDGMMQNYLHKSGRFSYLAYRRVGTIAILVTVVFYMVAFSNIELVRSWIV